MKKIMQMTLLVFIFLVTGCQKKVKNEIVEDNVRIEKKDSVVITKDTIAPTIQILKSEKVVMAPKPKKATVAINISKEEPKLVHDTIYLDTEHYSYDYPDVAILNVNGDEHYWIEWDNDVYYPLYYDYYPFYDDWDDNWVGDWQTWSDDDWKGWEDIPKTPEPKPSRPEIEKGDIRTSERPTPKSEINPSQPNDPNAGGEDGIRSSARPVPQSEKEKKKEQAAEEKKQKESAERDSSREEEADRRKEESNKEQRESESRREAAREDQARKDKERREEAKQRESESRREEAREDQARKDKERREEEAKQRESESRREKEREDQARKDKERREADAKQRENQARKDKEKREADAKQRAEREIREREEALRKAAAETRSAGRR